MLYDGKCPLCLKEIRFLQWVDTKIWKRDSVDWVDISLPDYDSSKHSSIDYSTAMGAMHVIGKDGKVSKNNAIRVQFYNPFFITTLIYYI